MNRQLACEPRDVRVAGRIEERARALGLAPADARRDARARACACHDAVRRHRRPRGVTAMWTRGSSERRATDRRGLERRLSRLLAAFGTRRADLNPLDRTDRPDDAFETSLATHGARPRRGRAVRARPLGRGASGAGSSSCRSIQHDDLRRQAIPTTTGRRRPLEAQRGNIVDRNGPAAGLLGGGRADRHLPALDRRPRVGRWPPSAGRSAIAPGRSAPSC